MVKELQSLSTKSSLNNSLLSNVWLININNHLHLFQIRSTSSLGRYTGSFPALSTFHNPKLSFEYHHYSPLTFSPAFLSAVTLSCFCAPNSLCWGHLHCRETLPGPSGETQPFVLPGKAAILQLLLKEKHPVLSLHSRRTAQLHNLWRHVAGHWHKVFPQLCINTLDFLLQRYTNVGIYSSTAGRLCEWDSHLPRVFFTCSHSELLFNRSCFQITATTLLNMLWL